MFRTFWGDSLTKPPSRRGFPTRQKNDRKNTSTPSCICDVMHGIAEGGQ